MNIEGQTKLIRVYVGTGDQWEGRALSNAIVQRARQEGMAGTSVMQGVEGFGANSHIHRAALMELSTDLPVVIEIVDEAEKVARFLPMLEEMVTEGLIIVLDCQVVKYAHRETPRS
jgi:PII-like signaling protein